MPKEYYNLINKFKKQFIDQLARTKINITLK